MNKFFVCVIYLIAIGILSNPAAKFINRDNIDYTKFPYRSYSFERGGKIYEKIGIRFWKDKVPDMSAVLKHLIKKEVRFKSSAADVLRQIQETCVAEKVHVDLSLASVGVLFIWESSFGFFIWFLCFLGNLPYILIQRYNRPRLVRTYRRRQKQKEGRT